MTITPEDITGGKSKFSATNPANNKSTPSLIESFLTGLMKKPNPPEKELYLGDKPPVNSSEIEGIIDRKSVIDIAKTLTDKVPEKLLVRICDAIFNDGISMPALQKISSMRLEEEVFAEAASILSTAGLSVSPLPMDNVEALVAVSRALLRYIHTHHLTKTVHSVMRKLSKLLLWLGALRRKYRLIFAVLNQF